MRRPANKSLRVLVADDHEVVRRGVEALLRTEPGVEICGEAVTGREALEKARLLRPDIVVLDIGMPELNGLAAARHIRETVPESEVLILTMHESEQLVREVVAVGARGYVLKSNAGRDLIAAVKALREHKPFFSASAHVTWAGEPVGGGHRERADRSVTTLTPREREILELLAQGKSNRAIAGTLGISIKTVDTHRTNMMEKLDLHSVGELVRYAIRNGLIEA